MAVRTKSTFEYAARYGSIRNVYFGQIQNYNTKSYAECKRIPLCAIFCIFQSPKENL